VFKLLFDDDEDTITKNEEASLFTLLLLFAVFTLESLGFNDCLRERLEEEDLCVVVAVVAVAFEEESEEDEDEDEERSLGESFSLANRICCLSIFV
jgi:hypothetical protein